MALTEFTDDTLIQISPDVPPFQASIDPGLAADWIADEDSGPTVFIMPATVVYGGFIPPDYIFFPSSAPAATTTVVLPETADPPFPPVWPYKFTTNEIYGREHMNQVLRMTRGDRYPFTANAILDGDPFNLTSYAVTFTAKWEIDDLDANAVISLTEGSGITVTDATGGVISVVIPPSATRDLPDTEVELYYDLQISSGSDVVYTILWGKLVIRPDIRVAIT